MGIHRLFEAARDPLAIVCFQFIGIKRNVQRAKGIIPMRRDRYIALQVNGWLAVGKPDADDCQQRCGRNRKCKPPGVLFRGLFCCGRAVLCTASAIGAERQIVVNLFTTMCTSHFGFLLVFVPVVLPGLPDLSYTITIGAAFCNVKTDFKKICRAQKNKKEPFAAPFYSVSDLCLFVPASVQ